MKQPKRLTREHKRVLTNMKLNPNDYLIERNDSVVYVFYNIHTKQLMEVLK